MSVVGRFGSRMKSPTISRAISTIYRQNCGSP